MPDIENDGQQWLLANACSEPSNRSSPLFNEDETEEFMNPQPVEVLTSEASHAGRVAQSRAKVEKWLAGVDSEKESCDDFSAYEACQRLEELGHALRSIDCDLKPVLLHHSSIRRSTSPSDGCTECIFASPDTVSNIFQYPLILPKPVKSRPYTIIQVPGKGKGMVANRTIKFGGLIAIERPLIISTASTHYFLGEGCPSLQQALAEEMEGYLEVAVQRMRCHSWMEGNAEIFLGLHNGHPREVGGPLSGRFRTNAYYTSLKQDPSATYWSVFADVSRVNHSCSPNAVQQWDSGQLSMRLHAVRDIKPGEEITIAYVPYDLPVLTRQNLLLERYAFKCTCRGCSDPMYQLQRERVLRIELNIPSIVSWAAGIFLPDDFLLKPLLESLKLIQDVGMESDSAYWKVLCQLYFVYLALGIDEVAQKYWETMAVYYLVLGEDPKEGFMEVSVFGQSVLSASLVRRARRRANGLCPSRA